jgi:acyl-homoserine-lactone acylase
LNNFNVRGERILSAELFTTPFDRQQPVNTPTGLRPIEEGVATNDDPILQSLAIAVQRLAVFEIALDARLGDLQYHMKNDERLPIPGGAAVDGVFNINSSGDISTSNNGESEVTADGYPVAFGASWLMALEFTETGPKAEGLIVYGQSHDPESENYVDQTRLFSEGSWRPIIFTKQEIASDLVETINLSGN